MDGGAWWAAVHGVARSRTWLSDFTFTLHLHALEKEMATHSSVLAWRISGMGSHRVGHDWSDLAAAAAVCIPLETKVVIFFKLTEGNNFSQFLGMCDYYAFREPCMIIFGLIKELFLIPEVEFLPAEHISLKVKVWILTCVPYSLFNFPSSLPATTFLLRRNDCSTYRREQPESSRLGWPGHNFYR